MFPKNADLLLRAAQLYKKTAKLLEKLRIRLPTWFISQLQLLRPVVPFNDQFDFFIFALAFASASLTVHFRVCLR
jgi:hypothetical protein